MIAKMLRGLRARAGGREVGGDEAKASKAGGRPWVVHPFLIAVFPIISLYSHNVYETQARSLIVPIVVALVATSLAWLALRLASGDASRAGLATSLLVVSFFGFRTFSQYLDPVRLYLMRFWVYHETPMHPMVASAWLVAAIAVGFYLIFRRWGDASRWTRSLNAFTLILVAMPAFGIASARMVGPARKPLEVALPAASAGGWKPDIYFIVLDGYARSDVMKELFDFDNEPFLARLERRGFFVARRSHSNYCQTRLSLASTLNGDYLDKMVDTSNPDLLPLSGLIKDNLVSRLLRPLGYQSAAFATGWEPTEHSEADLFYAPKNDNAEFPQLLLDMTPVGALLSEIKFIDRYSARRDRTLYVLDRLADIALIRAPTFTFAHIVSPHPPFVFGEEGEDVSPRRVLASGASNRSFVRGFGTPEYFRDAYRKQSAFITTRIERTIDRILSNSPEPPIIILQSDHGSWLRYHPDDVEASDLRERFGILNCIYVPDRKVAGINDTMASVNTFRAILTEVIGADLPPLEERNYFSNYNDPLAFVDVTKRLHSEQERTRKFQYPAEYPGLEQQF